MSVVAAYSTLLSDEADCSDASSDQLDYEAQPGSGCGELHTKWTPVALYDVQDIIVVLGRAIIIL